MNVSDFDYDLPAGLIAQEPVEPRNASRLMVIDRQRNSLEHQHFTDIIQYLRKGDCLVINNARVMPARLEGVKIPTGGKVEFLLLSQKEEAKWEALVKPGRRLSPGAMVSFGDGVLKALIEKRMPGGNRIVSFEHDGNFHDILQKIGEVPLPPYITRPLADSERYQTIYSSKEGAVAAPTAGLHFTPELLEEARAKGAGIAEVTLDVGLDSFRPVKELQVEKHRMHSERFELSEKAAFQINETIERGGRIVAVGTTSARVLETVATPGTDSTRRVEARSGRTSLFMYPGYSFSVVDVMITNFHLPKSTLLMLVAGFASPELIRRAYREAIKERYRFYSFGDAMLII